MDLVPCQRSACLVANPHAHCPGCGAVIGKSALMCGRCLKAERAYERRLFGVFGDVHAEAEADAYRALGTQWEQHRDEWAER